MRMLLCIVVANDKSTTRQGSVTIWIALKKKLVVKCIHL
jgi:hypothetical protein